jgi:MFS family permease
MLTLSGSPTQVALVQTSLTLPIMLFSLAAGALADNYDRRKVMLVAQFGMLTVSLGLVGFAYLGLVRPWSLLLFTFLIGCGTALYNPAWQSSVREMVPRPDLPQAIALNSVGMNLARSVGPALGGSIVAAAGASAAFAVNALSYIGLIGVLLRWRPARVARTLPPETLGVAMGAGIRFAAMSPTVRTVLVRALVLGLGGSAVQALMPLVARDLLQGGPVTLGLPLSAFGVGAIAGGLFSSGLREAFSTEALARFAFVGFALCAFITGFSPGLAVTMVAMALGGGCWVLVLSSLNVTVQLSTPLWVVGRALALYQTAAFGGMAVGSWIWGELAESIGTGEALFCSGLALLVGAALGLRFPLPQQEYANLEPLNRWREPDLAVEITPRSGPIVIIREENALEFLRVMGERRQMRRRDGARHWRLTRDLTDPELWIERYDTPTWLDYIRHAQRITYADAPIVERLRELHCGSEPPRVRRMIERQTGSVPPELASQDANAHRGDSHLPN